MAQAFLGAFSIGMDPVFTVPVVYRTSEGHVIRPEGLTSEKMWGLSDGFSSFVSHGLDQISSTRIPGWIVRARGDQEERLFKAVTTSTLSGEFSVSGKKRAGEIKMTFGQRSEMAERYVDLSFDGAGTLLNPDYHINFMKEGATSGLVAFLGVDPMADMETFWDRFGEKLRLKNNRNAEGHFFRWMAGGCPRTDVTIDIETHQDIHGLTAEELSLWNLAGELISN